MGWDGQGGGREVAFWRDGDSRGGGGGGGGVAVRRDLDLGDLGFEGWAGGSCGLQILRLGRIGRFWGTRYDGDGDGGWGELSS